VALRRRRAALARASPAMEKQKTLALSRRGL
jgi:hypothetical protein